MKRGGLKREGELLRGGGGLLERGAHLKGGLNTGFTVYEPKLADPQVTSLCTSVCNIQSVILAK